MQNIKEQLPRFADEDQARKFWGGADSTRYLNWEKAKPQKFPRLRRSQPIAESPDDSRGS